jgi:membrane protein
MLVRTAPVPPRSFGNRRLTRPFASGGIGHGTPVTSKTPDTSEGRRVPGEVIEDREPDSPVELEKPSWKYVMRKTAREFSKDQCTDLAAALTYYAVLALFPAAIALLSLVGLVGQGPQTVKTLLGILEQIGAGSATQTLGKTLTSLATAPRAAGFAFVIGLLSALWSASGYVGAFGRAMNRMYEVREGRPIWKLRPVQLLVTLVSLILVALVAMALVLTGPAAKAVGDAIGLGSTAVLIWDIVKWPVIIAVVVFIVAVLYYATPNVKQPKFRWVSIGAIFAIVVWVIVSAAFGFYVSNFGSYNKTYGALAGVIVFLLWLWLTNLALLFGAELDAELERGRELQAGIPAEKTVQLPPRDTRNIKKAEKQEAEDIERGRELRETYGDSAGEDSGQESKDGASRGPRQN